MKRQSKGGNGTLLLLTGLGVGAALLLAGKSKAAKPGLQEESSSDIPNAPKILAVNTESSESPLPTGIVSDEEGMQTKQQAATKLNSGDDDTDFSAEGAPATSSQTASVSAGDEGGIPPLVSTKLTPKEKSIIDKGKLTASLALKRPDLYKAAYIKRYGGKSTAGKRKALVSASLAIDAAVQAAQVAQSGGLTRAVRYPAKPQYTFVQTEGGGMSSQSAVERVASVQKAGLKVSPAARKISAQVKAAKGQKGRNPISKTPAAASPMIKRTGTKNSRQLRQASRNGKTHPTSHKKQ